MYVGIYMGLCGRGYVCIYIDMYIYKCMCECVCIFM
jgi:hypothetical protein